MKTKITSIIITILTVVLLLTGCNSEPSTPSTDTSSTNPIPAVESVVSETQISTEEAVKLFEQDSYANVEGYELDNNGYLSKENEGSLGNIHTLGLNTGITTPPVFYSREAIVYWENDKLTHFSFGKQKGMLFEGYTFCGFSDMNGFVLRKDDKVYLVSLDLNKTTQIASDVKFVLDCDYAFNSDAWAQPLFIMNDGSIKCYVSWEDELMSPSYEGGYGGTYIQ